MPKSYVGRKYPGFYSKPYVLYRRRFGPANSRISDRLQHRIRQRADHARLMVHRRRSEAIQLRRRNQYRRI